MGILEGEFDGEVTARASRDPVLSHLKLRLHKRLGVRKDGRHPDPDAPASLRPVASRRPAPPASTRAGRATALTAPETAACGCARSRMRAEGDGDRTRDIQLAKLAPRWRARVAWRGPERSGVDWTSLERTRTVSP